MSRTTSGHVRREWCWHNLFARTSVGQVVVGAKCQGPIPLHWDGSERRKHLHHYKTHRRLWKVALLAVVILEVGITSSTRSYGLHGSMQLERAKRKPLLCRLQEQSRVRRRTWWRSCSYKATQKCGMWDETRRDTSHTLSHASWRVVVTFSWHEAITRQIFGECEADVNEGRVCCDWLELPLCSSDRALFR